MTLILEKVPLRSVVSPCSVLPASVSLPGLSDLAPSPQNALLRRVDHGERRPPLGQRRARPRGVGAAPWLGKAKVRRRLSKKKKKAGSLHLVQTGQ